MIVFPLILEALLISSACSMDCLVTGFAYGSNKIKIPFFSALIINLVCVAVLGISLFSGSFIGKYVPAYITLIICCAILIFLGFFKIAAAIIKTVVKRKAGLEKEVKFSFFSLDFILKICSNPESADINQNKILSLKEAAALAVALSLDGLAVGLGAGIAAMGVTVYFVIIAFSLVTNVVFLLFGRFAGNKIAQKTSLNLSWLSGLLLIGLALMKIFL